MHLYIIRTAVTKLSQNTLCQILLSMIASSSIHYLFLLHRLTVRFNVHRRLCMDLSFLFWVSLCGRWDPKGLAIRSYTTKIYKQASSFKLTYYSPLRSGDIVSVLRVDMMLFKRSQMDCNLASQPHAVRLWHYLLCKLLSHSMDINRTILVRCCFSYFMKLTKFTGIKTESRNYSAISLL